MITNHDITVSQLLYVIIASITSSSSVSSLLVNWLQVVEAAAIWAVAAVAMCAVVVSM